MRARRFVTLCWIGLAALAALAAVAPVASAQDRFAPAALYGADVRSLTFDPAAPDRAFAGTSAGHVYRSDDGGESWRDAGVHVPFPGWVVGTLRFDPNRPDRLWAGLWGIWGGGAIAVSPDLGASWEFRDEGLPEGDQVYALAPVPGLTGRWFAATRTGVWRTEDDGGAWRRISESEPKLIHVSSLLVDPLDPARLLAGTWRRAWRSDDGGATWRGAFDGMVLDSEVFSLSPVPGRPGEIWASTCGWVYRGEEFGERWTRFKEGFGERRTHSFLVVSPERLLAGTIGGLHVSTDGGRTFRRTGDARLPVLALAAHPSRPERVLVGTEGAGVWLSLDGGESASPRLVATSNVRVPALAAVSDTILAAVAHAGPLSGVYSSPNRGVSFEPSPAELPTVLELALAGDRIFAATERGLFERSAGEWRLVKEVGSGRVDQLASGRDRFLALTGGTLFELAGERFRKLAPTSDAIEGAAVAWGDLWIRTAAGLWRAPSEGVLEAATLPSDDAAIVAAGDGWIVAAGDEGLFRRDARDAPWRRLAGKGARVVTTGDGRFPLLVTAAHELALFDGESGELLPIASEFPAGSALSALVTADRLLVGTSGYGLWSGPLPTPLAPVAPVAPATPEASAAPDAEALTQSAASEARMRR